MVEGRVTRDGARDIRDTCDGGQWGVEMCRDQATSWHVSHVWWMDTCPGPGVITLSTAGGDRKYIYIYPGIMISGSMVMMIAASTVQWQYLSRRFHDVGVSSPYFEDIVSKMWEHFYNYLSTLLLNCLTSGHWTFLLKCRGTHGYMCSVDSSGSFSSATKESAICS